MRCDICEYETSYLRKVIGGEICNNCRWYYPNQIRSSLPLEHVGIELEYEGGDFVQAVRELKNSLFLYKVGMDSGLLFGGLEIATLPLPLSYFLSINFGEMLQSIKGYRFVIRHRCSMHVNLFVGGNVEAVLDGLLANYYKALVRWEEYLACLAKDQRLKFFNTKEIFYNLKEFKRSFQVADSGNPRDRMRYFVFNLHAVKERACVEHRYYASSFNRSEIYANALLAQYLHKEILKGNICKFWELLDKVPLTLSQRKRIKNTIRNNSPNFLKEVDWESWDYRNRWGDGTQ